MNWSGRRRGGLRRFDPCGWTHWADGSQVGVGGCRSQVGQRWPGSRLAKLFDGERSPDQKPRDAQTLKQPRNVVPRPLDGAQNRSRTDHFDQPILDGEPIYSFGNQASLLGKVIEDELFQLRVRTAVLL